MSLDATYSWRVNLATRSSWRSSCCSAYLALRSLSSFWLCSTLLVSIVAFCMSRKFLKWSSAAALLRFAKCTRWLSKALKKNGVNDNCQRIGVNNAIVCVILTYLFSGRVPASVFSPPSTAWATHAAGLAASSCVAPLWGPHHRRRCSRRCRGAYLDADRKSSLLFSSYFIYYF